MAKSNVITPGGDVEIRLVTELSELNKGMGDAERMMKKSFGNISTTVGYAMTAFGGAVVGGIGAAVKGFADYSEEIDTASKKTGMTTDAVQEFKFAAEQSSATLGDVTSAVKYMANNLDAASQAGEKQAAKIGDLNEKYDEATEKLGGMSVATKGSGEQIQKHGEKLYELGEKLQAATVKLDQMRASGQSTNQEIDKQSTTVEKLSVQYDLANRKMGELTSTSGTSTEKISAQSKKVEELGEKLDEAGESTAGAARAFQMLGLNVDELKAMKPEDAFTRILEALAGTQDMLMRTALAQDIFGKGSQALMPLLAEGAGGIARLRAEAHELGGVLDNEAIVAGEAFGDEMQKLKVSMMPVAADIAQTMMPIIQDLAAWLQSAAHWVAEFSKEHPILSSKLIEVTAALGAFSFLFGPMLITLPKLAYLYTGLQGGISILTGKWHGAAAAAKEKAAAVKEAAAATEAAAAATAASSQVVNSWTTYIDEASAGVKELEGKLATSTAEVKEQEAAVKAAERALAAGTNEYASQERAVESARQALIKSNQELTESKTKLEVTRAEAKNFAAGLDTTGISAGEMAAKLRAAKQEVVENEAAVKSNNQALKDAKVVMETAGASVKELEIKLEGAHTGADSARVGMSALDVELGQAGNSLKQLKIDAEIASTGLTSIGQTAMTTRGHVANLGSKIGNVGGLASDILQLVGITSPAAMKVAEFGNVAAQVGYMFGGAGTAAVVATAGIAGMGTAATAATGAAGAAGAAGAGVLGLVGGLSTLGILLVGAGGWYVFAKGVLAVKESIDQLHESEQGLEAQETRYIAQLKERGVVFNEASLAAMNHQEKMQYLADREKANLDSILRYEIQTNLGRAASAQEFAQARNLALNEYMSAEEAAAVASMGISAEKMLTLVRADEQHTAAILAELGIRHDVDSQVAASKIRNAEETAAKQKEAEVSVTEAFATCGGLIVGNFSQAMSARETVHATSVGNMVEAEAAAADAGVGIWGGFFDWLSQTAGSVFDWIGEAFSTLWEGITGGLSSLGDLLGFAGGGVVTGMAGGGLIPGLAAGGMAEHRIVMVGEQGPEPAVLPVGTRVMSNAEMRAAIAEGQRTNYKGQMGEGMGEVNVTIDMRGALIRENVDLEGVFRRAGDILKSRLVGRGLSPASI